MPALVHETLASANLLDAEHPPFSDALAYAFHKCPGFNFLPSVYDGLSDGALPANGSFASAHFSCDAFRMYEFKVRRCMRGRSHDWTECPFAHPGEKARRRDPRRIHYSGSPCPDFRKGSCRRGEACEFAHGVFECWLHPARYRTQECKDGQNCKRRVCFFAHSPEQLRVLPGSPEQRTTRAERAFDRAAGSCVEESNNGFSENAPFPNFTGIMKAHQFSPSLAASQTQTFPPPVQASLLAMHQDLTSVSGLRRPAAQNVLSYKGHGINLDAAEYIPVVDVNDEGLPKPHVACTPYLSTMQHVHLRNCRDENLFAKFSLPAEMSSYDFSNHSHGFNSPTSILTGHIFSPPPLSPPLSPSNSPNSNDIKQFFTDSANDCHNSFVEILHKNICDQIVARDNPRDMEDLGLRLQNLHVAFLNGAGYAEPNPGMGTEAELSTNLVQQPRISPFKNPALNFTHTSKQVEGGYASEFACSDCSIFDIWRVGEATAQSLSIRNHREDRTSADKFEPDVSWVNELVK